MGSLITSWRTSALGVAGAICVAAALVYTALGGDLGSLDLSGAGVQTPVADLVRTLGEVLIGLGLVASRDHGVSSEVAKANPLLSADAIKSGGGQ